MDTYRSGMQFPANAVIKISQTAYSRLRVKWTFPVSAIFRNSGDEIRETRRAGRGVFCSECGVLLEDPEEDAQWHFEDHEGRPERNHYAVDGEHDGDLDGYDDEPEEDYCDEDDGYDCD
jgi:hypothetical protein